MAYRNKTIASVTTAGAVAATALTEEINLGEMVNFSAILNVTAAATDVGDILAVWIQGRIGGVWHDIARFADVLGNGGAVKRRVTVLGSDVSVAEEAVPDGTLSAGAVRNGPWGDALRVKYSVTDANANSAFTFSVALFAEG